MDEFVGDVVDNPAEHRYEMKLGDDFAFAYYSVVDGRIILTHTEVPQALSGHGYGSRLARGVFERIKERGQRAIVRCPFMAAYVARHPEYGALLDG